MPSLLNRHASVSADLYISLAEKNTRSSRECIHFLSLLSMQGPFVAIQAAEGFEWDLNELPKGSEAKGMKMIAPTALPDLLSLIPEGNPKAVIRFALGDLGLSSEDLRKVLYDAHRLSCAIDVLLSGGVLSPGSTDAS